MFIASGTCPVAVPSVAAQSSFSTVVTASAASNTSGSIPAAE
jgi:hypothetical protein